MATIDLPLKQMILFTPKLCLSPEIQTIGITTAETCYVDADIFDATY